MRNPGLAVVVAVVCAGCVQSSPSPRAERSGVSWEQIAQLPWPAPQTQIHNEAAARNAMWREVYNQGGVELYCRLPFSAENAAARRVGNEQLSPEHAYPAEFIARHFHFASRRCDEAADPLADQSSCSNAVSDLRNLWPAVHRMNQSRGIVPYGEIEGEGTRHEDWDFCPDFERQYVREGPELVEPTDAARGDLARSILYMHFVYDLPLEDVISDRRLLLAWHDADPPDAAEIAREDAVEALQHNGRSPLIPRS